MQQTGSAGWCVCEWLSTTLDTFPFRPPFPAPVPHLVVDALPAVQELGLFKIQLKCVTSCTCPPPCSGCPPCRPGPQSARLGTQTAACRRPAAATRCCGPATGAATEAATGSTESTYLKGEVPGSTRAGQYAQYILGCYLPARLQGINNLGRRQQELLCWSTLHSVHACTNP